MITLVKKTTYLNLEKKKVRNMNQLLLLNYQNFSVQLDSKRKYCVSGRHMRNTYDIRTYEEVNPKTQKIVKVMKGKCDIFNRNKSKTFTK